MRRAQRRRGRGGQFGGDVSAELPTPARQLLLSCRATPPLRGGEFVTAIPKRNPNADPSAASVCS